MAREYELTVVLSSEITPEEVPSKMELLRKLVSDHGGSVSDVIDWGRRRLAYPLRKQFEGHYVITQYTAETGSENKEMERLLEIDEQVLRHLIVRRDD